MNVGVIGLGTMGRCIFAALLGAGYEVTVCDVSVEAVERAVRAGAEPAATPSAVGAASRVVLLSLPLPEHVAGVVAGENGLLSGPTDGLVIVDTSTIDPGTTRRLAEEAALSGAGYLDAPVLGRPDACGGWTLPVGGDAKVLEVVRPALGTIAGNIVHAGGPGAGQVVKLLNNLMFGAINAVTAEALAAAPLLGVSPQKFYEIVAGSGAATVSNLFRELGPKILKRDFAPTFSVDLLCKDNRLAVEMVEGAGGSAVVGSAAGTINGLARGAGYGEEDTSAVVKVYENLRERRGAGGEPDVRGGRA